MTEITQTALEMKRAYQREWREKNRESVRQYYKEYCQRPENKEKKKAATARYWNKKAEEAANS
jgi:hypothetical protein